jgi:organic hydroperoxide reductase OsmC/OhrA
MTDFNYAVDAEGVALITWDVPGKSMNVMTLDGLAELDGLIDRAHADPAPGHIDPEEAFIAAIASCHMLWFLHLAGTAGFKVASYTDNAVGTMGRTDQKRMAITEVTLRPAVVFAGPAPDASARAQLHEQAHEKCFIANSVTSKIAVQPA